LLQVISKAGLQQQKERQQRLEQQFAVQQAMQHEHVVRLLGSFEDSSNVYVLMEPCSESTMPHSSAQDNSGRANIGMMMYAARHHSSNIAAVLQVFEDLINWHYNGVVAYCTQLPQQ
jgi:serine/threonine protein kinase